MKISCDRITLTDRVSFCLGAVASKSTIPALEGIFLNAADGVITLTGYDLEIAIKTSMEAEVKDEGGIVLNGRMFSDILKSLPDEQVVIESDERYLTTITCGKSLFTIIGIPAEDFPELQKVEGEKSFVLPQGILKSMISETLFAVSMNENKPVQMGCLFDISKGFLNVVAVDGFRLALRREGIGSITELGELSFVVPGSTLKQIERILNDNDEQVELILSQKNMSFLIDKTLIVARLLEGDFINYKNVIPKSVDIEVRTSVKNLQLSVDRVALIVNERLKNPVKMTVGYDTIKLSCTTAVGQSYDECPSAGNGGDIEIGFNSRYLLDALKAIRDEEVVLRMTNPLSPCLFYPVEGDKFLYLILPVRLRAGDA